MKVHLTDTSGNVCWLAGHDCDPECLRTSARDYNHQGQQIVEPSSFARGAVGAFFDRQNFTTQLTFSATRTFTTSGEACLFIADYDRVTPRFGFITLIVTNPHENGGEELRYLLDAVVDPPNMTNRGAAVVLDYTIRGSGPIINQLPLDLQMLAPPAMSDKSSHDGIFNSAP